MTIVKKRMAMPPKASPTRTSPMRDALVSIAADSDEAVLLFPEPDKGVDLDKLRNRASGVTSNLRKRGMFFVTRTTEAVPPGAAEGAKPEKCVGIWKVSTDPNASNAEAAPAPQAAEPAQKSEPKAEAKTNGNGAAKGNGTNKAKSKDEDLLDNLK